MNEPDNFALVPRAPGALEKAAPGSKRILSGMIADTLVLAKKESVRKPRPLRIVVVYDEDGPRKSLEFVIRYTFPDAKLLLFQSSVEALEVLSQRDDPDLLITGTWFPVIRGKEFVERVTDRKATYPIVVASAFEPEETWVREYARRGMNISFLPLPYTLESLRNALEAAGLKIPSGLATPDETNAIKHQAQAPKRRGKLLIVDDEEGVRFSMRFIFKDDYEVFLADNGLTAIELAEQNDVDVVVTNIRMPGMSGIELLERLKFLKPDIEVIIATAFETADTRLQALQLGASDYINKPIDLATMRAAVTKAMQRRTHESGITAARKQPVSNTEKVSDMTLQTRPPRIVIVDDEEWFVEFVGLVVRDWFKEATLLVSTNAAEALRELSTTNPDLLILGMVPLGAEILPLLAERDVQYPILATSGYMQEAKVRRIAGSKLNLSFIAKPFTIEQFRAELIKRFGPGDNPERTTVKPTT